MSYYTNQSCTPCFHIELAKTESGSLYLLRLRERAQQVVRLMLMFFWLCQTCPVTLKIQKSNALRALYHLAIRGDSQIDFF